MEFFTKSNNFYLALENSFWRGAAFSLVTTLLCTRELVLEGEKHTNFTLVYQIVFFSQIPTKVVGLGAFFPQH